MSEPHVSTSQKDVKPAKEKGTPIGRMSIAEVDSKLTECDRSIKSHSDTVKARLAVSAAIPPLALRELSKANIARAKLALRKIALLMESGDSAVQDQIDRLLKTKVSPK